jgi:hypothetical protein
MNRTISEKKQLLYIGKILKQQKQNWVRSLTPKILRPTWGNKAENIKAEKGGAEKTDRKKN